MAKHPLKNTGGRFVESDYDNALISFLEKEGINSNKKRNFLRETEGLKRELFSAKEEGKVSISNKNLVLFALRHSVIIL